MMPKAKDSSIPKGLSLRGKRLCQRAPSYDKVNLSLWLYNPHHSIPQANLVLFINLDIANFNSKFEFD